MLSGGKGMGGNKGAAAAASGSGPGAVPAQRRERKGGRKGFGKGGKGGGKGEMHGNLRGMDASYLAPQDVVSAFENILGPVEDCEDVRNLMINYIPNKISLEDLRMLFSMYGPVEHLRVIHDKQTNEPKGYGFVKYLYGLSAYSAVSFLNGYQVYRKRLKVSYAHRDSAFEAIDNDQAMQQRWHAQQPKLLEQYYEFKDVQFASYLAHQHPNLPYGHQ